MIRPDLSECHELDDASIANSNPKIVIATYLADKEVARVEANSPCETEESVGHDEHVAEVHEHRHSLCDVQLAVEVERGVGKQVQRRRPRSKVRPPPPVVILGTELEVGKHDGDLRAGDEQDDKHKGQEAKQVVELMQPHGRENEEELNEYGTEGEDTSDEAGEDGVHVPRLLRDLARDLVGADWFLSCGLLVAKVAAYKDEGHGDAKPEEAECKEGAEGDRARGFLAPDEQIQGKEDAEAGACGGVARTCRDWLAITRIEIRGWLGGLRGGR